jgi:hypothetical protein
VTTVHARMIFHLERSGRVGGGPFPGKLETSHKTRTAAFEEPVPPESCLLLKKEPPGQE